MRKLLVAGSTGVTGRALVRLADERGIAVVPHVRPRHTEHDPRAAVFELSDRDALVRALADCTTVVQCIGTMRKRFASGDTYESSDIGTTRELVEAAKRAGTIDHFILLSAVGAGKPIGAYLKAKAAAESLVTGSGIPYTIFRPSSLVGEDRKPPPGAGAITRLFGMSRFRPIEVDRLAAAMLYVAEKRSALGAVLEGEALWAVVQS